MSRALAIACALSALLLPARASAYLDGRQFEAPVIEGGGGGRFFTGAPADGYTCAVCHRGGGSPQIQVDGIPAEGWDPGATYELAITLPTITRNTGATLEIADVNGVGAGTLGVLPDADLVAADRCRTMERATGLVTLPGRLVARTEVCGATQTRVLWTAPAIIPEELRLFVVTVAGNDSSDVSGDGVSTLAIPLRARGSPEIGAGRLEQRCSVSAVGAAARSAWWLAPLVGALLLFRRARRKR